MAGRQKILFVCTEGWFFKSHFLPLARAANAIPGAEVCLAANMGAEREFLEQAGVRTLPVDFMRSSFGLFGAIRLLFTLIALYWRERPDVIHFIALKPVVFGGIAALFAPSAAKIYHVTGLGTLAESKTGVAGIARALIFQVPAMLMRQKRTWMLIENPDNLQTLREYGLPHSINYTILGGAGVDPDFYPVFPAIGNKPIRLAFVGRMIWVKGVDVLVRAMEILEQRNVPVQLDLYGSPDAGNPKCIPEQLLKSWGARANIRWHGRSDDVRDVWREADICVVPSRTGEGMPRAMLEAAACGRALIVTDVPGCRHFVRDGIEGLVIPPESAEALSEAIATLANDAALSASMGRAARARILGGYTEKHVSADVERVFRQLLEDQGIDHAGAQIEKDELELHRVVR